MKIRGGDTFSLMILAGIIFWAVVYFFSRYLGRFEWIKMTAGILVLLVIIFVVLNMLSDVGSLFGL